MAAIRTTNGPVDLRPKRTPVNVSVEGLGSGVLIKKDWLKSRPNEDVYRRAVYQAMLYAGQSMVLVDSLDAQSKVHPRQVASASTRQQQLLAGKDVPTVAKTKRKPALKGVARLQSRERDLLIKFSNKCIVMRLNRRERSFVVENGEMLVYKSFNEKARCKQAYNMRNANVFMETRTSASYPIWEDGFDHRLRVDAKERIQVHKAPVYLYADKAKLLRWKRAFALARLLTSELDRRALKVSIGRATSASLIKGWDCLSTYYREMKQTREMIRTVAMRLMKVELSRGYHKMRLAYRVHLENQRRKGEQRLWAARFMSERMARMSNTKAVSGADMRESVVTIIQRKFRRFRNDSIFNRTYPLGPSGMSKLQEAKLGRPLDVSFTSLSAAEVLMLSLEPEVLKIHMEQPTLFQTKKPTYSEVNIPTSTVHVHVTENLSSLSFSNAVADTSKANEDYAALVKADWSKFIHLDRIHCVIMHCEPHIGATLRRKDKAPDEGVWFSVNGPRLCWSKRLNGTDGDRRLQGAADGLEVPERLAQSKVMPWAQVRVAVGDAQLRKPVQETAPPSRGREVRKTVLYAHIFGYAYRSEERRIEGDAVDYNFCFEAALPLAQDDSSVTTLDRSELGVEIFEIAEGAQKLVLVGSAKLPKVFGAEGGNFQVAFARDGNFRLALRPPFSTLEDRKCEAGVSISIRTEVGPVPSAVPHFLGDRVPVSPEFMGFGMMTSLYSSHRSCWYDPKLGPSKFRYDHVANFVELRINSLRFPKDDTGTEGKKYKIKASIGPACLNTQYLTRPKESWSKVFGLSMADSKVLKFNGHRMCLPLPPGCWCDDRESSRNRISIQVWMLDTEPVQAATYHEYVSSSGKVRQKTREVMVYQANVAFKNVLVDVQKNVSVYMGRKKPAEVDMFTNIAKGEVTDCCVVADIALRDRDYVKAVIGQPNPSEKRAFCVGDKANLMVEEILTYPPNKEEFRRRFHQGNWDSKTAAEAAQNGGLWPSGGRVPLRQPCLSSEYAMSGFADLPRKLPFRQGFIPNFCNDIVPHQFVLPLTEKQFLDKSLPGNFAKIVDDLVENPPKDIQNGRNSGAPKHVVTHLSSVTKKISVTLLATYADGTCDVELAPEFMQDWSTNPSRKFMMPGQLSLDRGMVPPGRPTGGDASKTSQSASVARSLVKRLPIMYLQAVQGASFHIYDSMFHSTADVLTVPLPDPGFDPRLEGRPGSTTTPEQRQQRLAQSRAVAAGPLPPDASGAACEYEWSIRMRASSVSEMHQFVAMLRRCARLENFQQASKMLECQRQAESQAVPAQVNPNTARPLFGGQLDVLLVEARRLVPTKDLVGSRLKGAAELLDRPELKLNEAYLPHLAGTVGVGEPYKCTPEGNRMVGIFVNFRMLHNKDIIPYRGQKVQASPILDGSDSPSWAAAPELKGKGGHLFHSGIIDPEKLPDLVIDFEVMQYGPVPGMTKRIGAIQLPVTQRQFLTNPNEPFKNFWLPLVSLQDGGPVPNPTGEIHVMCRWLPSDKIPAGPNNNVQQVSVRSAFMKQIWPRVVAQRVREPIYALEAQYIHYNPNLVRDAKALPESPKEHQRRHVEELSSTVPYLAAVERRQTQAWDEFEARLGDMQGVRLGETRLKWLEEGQEDKLSELQTLVHAGIPSARRAKIWSEITLAARVMERDGVSGGQPRRESTGERARKAAEMEYQMLLEKGLPLRSDAMMQLAEDAFNMASWESSVPPIAEYTDLHLRRLRRAQNVCTALIACPEGSITYCESLLVLAFFLLLPQGNREERNIEDTTFHYMSESQVFWLLYTLICSRVNGTYSEYYGAQVLHTLGSGGAVADVSLLECCLAYHEPKVWQHLNAIGFQLSSVFYGAFMRLFATYMPTSSVFRLWDALFAQSTDPKAQPHARVGLIDFAFGILRIKRTDLMQCESASEAKSLLLGVLGAMYDMSTVTDIMNMADTFLWGGSGFSSSKIAFLWTQRENAFQVMNSVGVQQNEVLKDLAQVQPLKFIPATKYESPHGQAGVTTRELLRDVLPVLNNSLENAKANRGAGKHWFMHRPMPLAAKMLNEGALQQTRTMVFNSIRTKPVRGALPFLVSPLPGRDGRVPMGLEPFGVSENEFMRVIHQDVPSWFPRAGDLWRSFTDVRADIGKDIANYGGAAMHTLDNEYTQGQGLLARMANSLFSDFDPPQTRRGDDWTPPQISINELFASLICCSRGTLAEKAAALFNIYSSGEPGFTAALHRVPVSKLAKSITGASEISAAMEKNVVVPDHDSESAKMNALRLSIFTNYPKKRTRVGDVYVPMLGPYINYGSHEPESQHFNIWGELGPGDRGTNETSPSSQANQIFTNGRKLVCIGDIEMVLTWTPKSIREPEVGQLMVHMKGIKFYKMYVTDYYKLNPWVEICTFHAGKQTEIPRWDPRGVIGRDGQQSWLTTHGAYGGIMIFEQTMKDAILMQQGDAFHSYFRDGKQGWDGKTDTWTWNEVWGKQYSTENFRMQKDFVVLSQRKNVMDIHGVRLIVSCILRRALLNFTNRQMLLIADEAFNRQGAVPGIIEALLVQGSDTSYSFSSLLEVKAYCTEKKISFVDVTNEVALEHERQIAKNGGYMNLFAELYMEQRRVNLSQDMGIQHYAYSSKVLWIRYVRGGDGERCTAAIPIERDGYIPPGSEVFFEMRDMWPQTKVTKDEFVSCLVNSPLLSEAVRRLAGAVPTPQARRALALDVTVLDPNGETQEYEIMDATQVGQSILLEVWDSDGLQPKDFLGEVWLPPLSQLGPRMRDMVLPLRPADFSEEADRGPSRPDDKKKCDPACIVGDLFISVAWKFPAYEVNHEDTAHEEAGESMHERALVQERLHTGKLTLKIVKARYLRRADAKKGRNSDPQVSVWVRNDFLDRWRQKWTMRTKIVANTCNPEWNYEKEVELQTGEFESRMPQTDDGFFADIKKMMRRQHLQQRIQDRQDVAALQRSNNGFTSAGKLELKFVGDAGAAAAASSSSSSAQAGGASSSRDGRPTPGANHQVVVYLGDSIREFKGKLTEACSKEAQFWSRLEGETSELAQRYRDINIGYRHLVMVFVPSAKVQRLNAQKMHDGEEYARAYAAAVNDPSSWQPLDVARCFSQYPQFGFGRKQAWSHMLRIAEATENYKLNNLRYKEYAREMNIKGYEDRDTKEEAFGWAQYVHAGDRDADTPTVEWRPCLVSNPQRPSTGQPTMASVPANVTANSYTVKWCFPPAESAPPSTSLSQNNRELRERRVVLLKPRAPQFDDAVHPMHVELLEQARMLRKAGKSDFDIELLLKRPLEEAWEAAQEASYAAGERVEIPRPPNLTVDVIRAYLQRNELDAVVTKASRPF
eukprot:TRINITY_DN5099_c0_g1_i1.p1 TRINITY_DN5099_c0_g1~~TRINITY_DN5099_c0_g1_i1.p1  ORF type:complete len:3333 (+),score=742.01 TRINITY_DN5099_c0_g1_i1:194-10192(+)